MPVAYYFIKSLTAKEKANILRLIVKKLNENNIILAGIICDGLASNLTMAKLLGVKLEINNFQTDIDVDGISIPFLFDACHMIKLVRNALFHYEVFVDDQGNEINIKYVKLLNDLQEHEGLRLCNKLTHTHINWKKQPMKVKLAVQIISSSVADAIDYCREVLALPDFKDSSATTRFLRYFDRLFDWSNSRNTLGKNFKAPLKTTNKNYWQPFVEEAFVYIVQLKLSSGIPLIQSPRKLGFLGFLTLIRSLTSVYKRFVEYEPVLKYCLTYKLSQDHLELFFSAIRSRGGYNNNPSAKQFIAAYKRILIHYELKQVAANCLDFETCGILNVSSAIASKCSRLLETNSGDEQFHNPNKEADDSIFRPILSLFVDSVVEYIAGFVVKRIKSELTCTTCASVLISPSSDYTLINFKNRGGLVHPSVDVLKICRECERTCRKVIQNLKYSPSSLNNLMNTLISVTFNNLPSNTFQQIDTHIKDFENFGQNHNFILIKKIIHYYFKIRLHHINNMFNIKLKGTPIRHHFNKIVLFSHQ